MALKNESSTEGKYICPGQAAKKLKAAQGMQQIVYLYGVTGSGKTALVKHVLGRSRYSYYSAEEARAEEIQIPEDGKYNIIVIDDLYAVTGECQRDAYAERLRILSKCRNTWVILISRCKVPQWLLPLHVENTFFMIREEDLCLDHKEQEAYFGKWNLTLPPQTAEQIRQRSGGNPLFLRFVALAGGDVKQAVSDMWKYLACIYGQWDLQLQEFMMEMSVVEKFDVHMAQIVTGRRDAQQLIRKALETGNFLIEKDGMYEYNVVLKDSVSAYLSRRFDREQTARIYYNAGHMYEVYGDVLHALKMYEAGQDEKSILRLLIANARQNPGSGHYFELRRFYMSLPEELICTSPVLMAGMSMLQSMLMNLEESERWYHLLEQFAAEKEGSMRREAKNRLLYLDIGLPHRGTVQMLNLLKHAGTLLKDGKAMLPEFSVTSNLPSMMNGGKDFCEWSKNDKELAATMGRIVEFVLGKYGKGLVSIALAESYLEKGLDSFEIVSLAEKGRMQAEAGGKTEQVFVASGLLVWLFVLNGRGEDAWDILNGFQKRAETEAPQLLLNLSAFQCRIFLYQGKVTQIMEWMETAPDENQDFCSLERFRYLTKIRCYLQFRKYEKAYGLLQQMLYYAEVQKRTYIAMEARLLLALVMHRMGEEGWRTPLQECITAAEEYHFVRILSREGGAVLKLLKAGDFVWKDEAYRKQVIQECEKMERYYPSYLKEKIEGEIILSENALNILRLQAEGYSAGQIAEMLGITSNTIKYHSKETYRKLGVGSRAAAVSEAKNRGLI